MSDWIEHDGGDMPVPGDTLVYVKFRDGTDDVQCRKPVSAGWWDSYGAPDVSNWSSPEAAGIVAYKVVKS